jgi:hypothetical protein
MRAENDPPDDPAIAAEGSQPDPEGSLSFYAFPCVFPPDL